MNNNILVEIIKHLPGRHNQKLHGRPHNADIFSDNYNIHSDEHFKKLSDISGWSVETWRNLDNASPTTQGYLGIVNANPIIYQGYKDVVMFVEQGGDPEFARDILRDTAGFYLAKQVKICDGTLYDYRSREDFEEFKSRHPGVQVVSGEWMSNYPSWPTPAFSWYVDTTVNLNPYLNINSEMLADEYFERCSGTTLPVLAMTVQHIHRNKKMESEVGVNVAANIYLRGSTFSGLLDRALPNKLAYEYLAEVGPNPRNFVDDSALDLKSPTAWYLDKQGYTDFPNNKILEWPTAQWLANKFNNPSMHRGRVLKVPDGDDFHYAYIDMLDELKPEDFVNGINTSPEIAFRRVLDERLKSIQEYNANLARERNPLNDVVNLGNDPYLVGDEDYGEGDEDSGKLDDQFPEAEPGNEYIRQLKSRRELHQAGNSMANCVGSYGKMCASGRTAVYQVTDGRLRANLELGRQAGNWNIRQLQGPNNYSPSDGIISIVRDWAAEHDIKDPARLLE